MNIVIDFVTAHLFAIVTIIGIVAVYFMTRTMAKYDKLKREQDKENEQ
jgi:hypothetical protein